MFGEQMTLLLSSFVMWETSNFCEISISFNKPSVPAELYQSFDQGSSRNRGKDSKWYLSR